jgi:hypothetical protein
MFASARDERRRDELDERTLSLAIVAYNPRAERLIGGPLTAAKLEGAGVALDRLASST